MNCRICGGDASLGLFSVCPPCIAKGPPIDIKAAWTELSARRDAAGIEDRHLSEMTADYFRDEFVPGVETLRDQERYET